MVDIEGRMAELFAEELDTQPIISQNNLDAVIKILGRPEQFGAESMSAEEEYRNEKNNYERRNERRNPDSQSKGKRLFRDPENKRVAGVCSGLAAYMGVEDPFAIRLVTIILAFAPGISVPLYLILWAIVPKARSASDRLSMRGEPINIDSIGRIIEDEIDSFSNTMNEIKDEFRSKKK